MGVFKDHQERPSIPASTSHIPQLVAGGRMVPVAFLALGQNRSPKALSFRI